MKKLLAVLLSLVSVICLSCALAGCGENEDYGHIYGLEQAYKEGLLSKDDLTRIAAIYNEEAQCTDTLDSQTELLIKNCEAERLRNDKNYPIAEAEADGIEIVRFYGKYLDCYAIDINNIYSSYTGDAVNLWFYIDGIGFHQLGHTSVLIWVKSK